MAFHFSRDTKVYMKWVTDGNLLDNTPTADTLYEIPVLDGFSFSQATNSSEITLNEAADTSGNSKRGRRLFNDSFAPAEWSFSTYMRPTTSAAANIWVSGGHCGSAKDFAIEGPLWGAMGATTYDLGVYEGGSMAATGVLSGGTQGDSGALNAATWEPNVFNFANSNKTALGVFDLYFVLGASGDSSPALYTTGTDGVSIYKIASCSVGTASIDFDIDGIAQIAWSGQGAKISEIVQLKTTAGATSPAVTGEESTTKGLVDEGISSTTNYIRQKLTNLAIAYDKDATTGTIAGGEMADDITYAVTLTGGNVTIENNLTYLTPETIGEVNQPLGHVMGTRSVSGNFTCYLNSAANGSMDLIEDLMESTGVVTNVFNMKFSIGGSSGPRVELGLPRAHLELPTHAIEDVISIDVNFHGLSTDLSSGTAADATNELGIAYQAS